nr:transketolase [Candidatus Levybacteria bacterium]
MEDLEKLARLIRYYCLLSTSTAGSGHLTSSLSSVELMTTLYFGGFLKFDSKNPDYPENDRVIFSKGHASPLFYSLWVAAGEISENELLTYRKFGSPLEGHPTMEFKYTEAPTGSLGQGLSVGVGIALAAKMDKLLHKTYVLMGDSETSEGQVWEAIEIASHYKLNNLIGIIDVNRLGQSTETMYGWDLKNYQKKLQAFGWEAIVVDGHDLSEISHAFSQAQNSHDQPVMIIAKTMKGKGIKKVENKDGFHGKALPYAEIGEHAKDLGEIDKSLRGKIAKPDKLNHENNPSPRYTSRVAEYSIGDLIATRRSYGETLPSLLSSHPSLVVLDGETSNSTFSEIIREKHKDKYFEMF